MKVTNEKKNVVVDNVEKAMTEIDAWVEDVRKLNREIINGEAAIESEMRIRIVGLPHTDDIIDELYAYADDVSDDYWDDDFEAESFTALVKGTFFGDLDAYFHKEVVLKEDFPDTVSQWDNGTIEIVARFRYRYTRTYDIYDSETEEITEEEYYFKMTYPGGETDDDLNKRYYAELSSFGWDPESDID
ncbi:hypothetical protein J5491_03500 [Candidatus Saccharibacteria bacterium]|nr:hypothetical protein [Candidatus Saccharibacteria bacterium]